MPFMVVIPDAAVFANPNAVTNGDALSSAYECPLIQAHIIADTKGATCCTLHADSLPEHYVSPDPNGTPC